jgi:DNA-binding GntR family transcriptional regulator
MYSAQRRVVSTVKAVCDAMENDIYSLHFTPGSRISEIDLPARYGVSRNTIREAIAFLIAAGLLVKVANKGVFVRQITSDDVREIFHLRGLLESEAIRLIVQSGTVPNNVMLAAEKLGQIEIADVKAHAAADIDFHEALVRSAGSSRLDRLYGAINAEVKLCIFQSLAFLPIHQNNAVSHMQILQAMNENTPDRAIRLLAEHMVSAIKSYELAYLVKESEK